MTQTIWLLAGAYIALGVLVLALNIRSGWPLWVRLACIVLVSALYFVTWSSLQQVRGWPTRTSLPAHFVFNASSVIEPDETSGKDGHIFMWVTPIIDDEPIGVPRAFVLPYKRSLHTKLENAREQMRNGQLQIGDASSANEARRASNIGYFAPPAQNINIQEMPEPRLPEK